MRNKKLTTYNKKTNYSLYIRVGCNFRKILWIQTGIQSVTECYLPVLTNARKKKVYTQDINRLLFFKEVAW